MDDELRTRLVEESHWRWVPGMVDTAGRRVVAPEEVPGDAIPDLDDWATVGALLGLIAAHDALSETLTEKNGMTDWSNVAEFCAHLAVLRLQEALGDTVAGRAAKSMSVCLETLINQQKDRGRQEEW